MKLDHSNSCVVLFRKASGYVRPDNQILVTIYSNDLVLALKNWGLRIENNYLLVIQVLWFL